jgi:hypothetical protein
LVEGLKEEEFGKGIRKRRNSEEKRFRRKGVRKRKKRL